MLSYTIVSFIFLNCSLQFRFDNRSRFSNEGYSEFCVKKFSGFWHEPRDFEVKLPAYKAGLPGV